MQNDVFLKPAAIITNGVDTMEEPPIPAGSNGETGTIPVLRKIIHQLTRMRSKTITVSQARDLFSMLSCQLDSISLNKLMVLRLNCETCTRTKGVLLRSRPIVVFERKKTTTYSNKLSTWRLREEPEHHQLDKNVALINIKPFVPAGINTWEAGSPFS